MRYVLHYASLGKNCIFSPVLNSLRTVACLSIVLIIGLHIFTERNTDETQGQQEKKVQSNQHFCEDVPCFESIGGQIGNLK